MSEVKDRMGQHLAMITDLQTTVKLLVSKSDDAKICMRCSNVRVLGLPEGSEGDHPADFAEAFFKDLLGLTAVSSTYVAEWAHRVPMGRPISGAPPRLFLVYYLNYGDRDHMLTEAKKHPTLQYGNAHIMLFPDFSPHLQNKSKTFTDVRRRLQDHNIKYGMLYPSCLRVQHEGS